MIFVTADTNSIVVPWREDIANLIPHGRPLTFKGERMYVIPNGHDEAKVARNVGIPVPAPILTRYDWPVVKGFKPWDIQKTTAALLTESSRCYVLNTMGTGKTRSAIFAADYLMKQGVIKKVLVVAPLSTLTPVWESEIFAVLPRAKIVVLHGDRAKRLKLLATTAEWHVINHHGVIMLAPELAARGYDAVVIDELAVFRNKSTELWKALTTVVNSRHTQFAWGLTGSPTPNEPADAWAQIQLLTPGNVPRTKAAFRDMTMRQVTAFKWAPRPEANDIVHKAMQPSVRFTRDDVMELPPTTFLDREVKLTGDAAKAYKMLFDRMRLLTQDNRSITAVNAGVLHSKLLQVACGYIYDDKGTVYELPGSERKDALLEIVEQAERKVIVFVPFLHALHGVADFLAKKGKSLATVHGGTPLGARNRIFKAFQEASDPKILVVHPQCCAHGLTLTSANTAIWYSPTSSLETYSQACARITRPGQTSKTLIVHLSGTQVEKLTYRHLRDRDNMQSMLLAMFHQQELEF